MKVFERTLIGVMMSVMAWCQAIAAVPSPLRATYLHPDRIIPKDGTPEEQSRIIRQTLDRLQSSGFNAVLPYFTGSSGQSFYNGSIHSKKVYGDLDPLRELRDEARQRNIAVFPVVCVTVCGNQSPTGILLTNPDWSLRNPDGSPLGYISPAHPDARRWLVSVAEEIARLYQPDGIILDYIRYHNRPLRLDVAAEQRFQATVPPGATEEEKKKLLQDFRENELTELVRMYHESLTAVNSDLALGIYTWGPHVAENHQIAQCWPRWVKAGYLDLVNVSGYYHHDKYGEKYLEQFEQKMRGAMKLNRETGRPVPLSFALGLVTSHGRVHSADDIRIYLSKASECEIGEFVTFTWGDLLPYLDELDQTGELRTFPSSKR